MEQCPVCFCQHWELFTTVVDRVLRNQKNEDDRIELKGVWPEPSGRRTARQLAGHANAARGERVLWIVGLSEEHGLIGVNLPTNPPDILGACNKPERLQDNIDSGYAMWVPWAELTPISLKAAVEDANRRLKFAIRNVRPMRRRNG